MKIRPPCFRLLPLAATALLFPVLSHAQWIGPDMGNYSNTGNWSGGVINDTITGTIPNDLDIVLDTNRTTTGDFILDYNNSTNFFLRANGGPTETLTLGGNMFISGGSNPDDNRFIKFGEGNDIDLNLGGANRLIMVSPGFRNNDGDFVPLAGVISNGGIIKDGSGRLLLEGGDDTFTGPLVIRNSQVELNNSIATQSIYLGYTGKLRINGSDKVSDTATVTMNGGTFRLNNQNSETIGTLRLTHGQNVVGWFDGDGNNTGTIQMTNFSRSGKATLLMGNKEEGHEENIKLLGTDYKVMVTNSSDVTSQLIGGSGGAGTTTQKVLPWASFSSHIENGGKSPELSRNIEGGMLPTQYVPNAGFLTYDATNGFRALNRTTEYFQSDDYTDEAGWTAGQNVRLTSNNSSGLDGTTPNGGNNGRAITLLGNRTINSLFVDRRPDGFGGSNGDMYVEVGNGNTLNITSGGIVVSGGSTEFINGTVNFGSADAYISVNGRVKFHSKITGTGDLVTAGNGYVHMEGDNSGWTGNLVVGSEFGLENKQSISPTNNIILAGNKMAGRKDDNNGRLNVSTGDGNSNAANAGNLTGNGMIRFGNPDDSNKKKLKLGSVTTNLDSGVYANRSVLAVGGGAFIGVGDSGAGVVADNRIGIITLGEDRDGSSGEQAGKQDGTLLFENNSSLKLDLAGNQIYDKITFMGGTNSTWDVEFLTGSKIELSLLDGYLPQVGTQWQIFSRIFNSDSSGWGNFAEGADVYGDNLMTFQGPAGYSWDLNNTGVLTLTSVVPEPSAFLLLGLGALILVQRRRFIRA